MGPSAFSYDDSLWPLLIVRLEGAMTDALLTEFLDHGHATLLRHERYVSLFDMSQLLLPSAEQRQRQILWAREHEALMRTYTLGSAFVITSPFVRTMLNLFFHFAPTPAPYVVVPSLLSGVQWALARLEQEGLHAHAERVRHLYLAPPPEPPPSSP